ncbi:MAG: membrane protein insertion efficiency factor YidD [Thermoanaerobaculia bacterium]
MPTIGRKVLVFALVVVSLLAILTWDLTRAPLDQWSARLLLGGIFSYQRFLSPALGRAGVRCRFEPSCSRYAAASIRKQGALVGSWRATWRVIRCGPWTAAGTVDPP